MLRSKGWIKTVLAMAAGALLVLAVQGLSEKWNRRPEAATLDQLAAQTMANLVQTIPWVGGGKIRGVAGLGDGRTFIVYTDDKLNFYQFGFVPGPTTPTR